jgi:hypothetical protein
MDSGLTSFPPSPVLAELGHMDSIRINRLLWASAGFVDRLN